jgi:hypothetical protein
MIEIIPDAVDTAVLYFHTRRSSGDEIAPFVEEFRRELPHTYIWAGDGCIEGQGVPDEHKFREAHALIQGMFHGNVLSDKTA